MNLVNFFYEDFPEHVIIDGKEVEIVTDFRDYIKLIDMLKDPDLSQGEKIQLLSEYFLDPVQVNPEAIQTLAEFISMASFQLRQGAQHQGKDKPVFSWQYDYPYILSGFLQDYRIDLETIPYLHWWKFRMLFDGLSEKTEIKQRIMYRSIDLGTIKDKDERKRIRRIQAVIALPENYVTDFDIGEAFAQ